MKRQVTCASALLALLAASPALAADYLLRPAYPQEFGFTDESLVRFEVGARYWYAWGGQNAGFSSPYGPVDLTVRDQTHLLELHGRIDDLYTDTYLKGWAGYGVGTTGTYSISPASSGSIGNQSHIGYAGIDYGWMPFGQMDDGVAGGAFVGYTYWKDAPDIGTGQVAASFNPITGLPATFTEARDNFDIHALRLGVRGTAEFDMFDIQAEVAAIPYAHVSGQVGGSSPSGFVFPALGGIPVFENAPTTLTGRGYGVMTEAMIGFHPTENLTIRAGGRAWYLQGELDAVFNGTVGGTAQPAMTIPSTYASLFRYGAMLELTGKF
ncbi:hypothetical protein ACFSX5_14875 [Devosia albogilva]|uniref:Outer membrane protein beta-barrel domain-containing protein n=1 Tax=Devosia albogilva TaxID=429726 RepID=A0ABW5QMY9_9HYPH